jgi:hypothetical protein
VARAVRTTEVAGFAVGCMPPSTARRRSAAIARSIAVARDIKQPHVEVRKLFDLVRDDVWSTLKHQQQPFTYGSPPGREDFYFVAGK